MASSLGSLRDRFPQLVNVSSLMPRPSGRGNSLRGNLDSPQRRSGNMRRGAAGRKRNIQGVIILTV